MPTDVNCARPQMVWETEAQRVESRRNAKAKANRLGERRNASPKPRERQAAASEYDGRKKHWRRQRKTKQPQRQSKQRQTTLQQRLRRPRVLRVAIVWRAADSTFPRPHREPVAHSRQPRQQRRSQRKLQPPQRKHRLDPAPTTDRLLCAWVGPTQKRLPVEQQEQQRQRQL